MFLIKLVTYLYISLICLVNTELIVKKLEIKGCVEKCLKSIQSSYINPTDFIIIHKANKKFDHIRLDLFPIVIQTNFSYKLNSYPLLKPNVYIITLSDKSINETFQFLVRSVNWNPRAKFIIIFDGNLSNLFEILLKYYVLNIAVLVPKSLTETEIVTFFPYDYSKPDNNRTDAVVMDICFEGVLQKNFNLFPAKLPKKWSNTTVRMILFEYPPYVMCRACEDKQKSGIEVEIFRLVQSVLGFKVTYVDKLYASWGDKLSNGSYEAAYGDLQTHNADMGIGLFHMNFTEYWDFDLSFPYMDDSVQWVVPIAKLEPRWKSIAKIFNWHIWLWLIISFSTTILTFYFAATCIPEINTYRKLEECFLIGYQCLVGQASHFLPKTVTVRMVFTIWLVFTCVISTVFQTQLTNVLNAVIYEEQLSNANDMLDSKMEFGFFPTVAYFFTNTNFRRDPYISKNFVPCNLSRACLDRVAFKGDFATIKSKRYLQYMIGTEYMDENGRSLMFLLEGQLYILWINMVFSKGFPMFEEINQLLLDVRSNGIVEYHYKKVDYLSRKAMEQAKHVGIRANSLQLDELQGVFGLIFIGWVAAFIAFLIELMVKFQKLFKNRR